MATTLYSDVTGPVATVATRCPLLVIISAIRDTVIDLCDRGQVWRYLHPDVSLVTPTYTYSFVPPDSNTVISMIEVARIGDKHLEILTPKAALGRVPLFPDVTNMGEPGVIWQTDQRAFNVASTPDVTYTLVLNVTLKPTKASTGADSVVIAEYQDTITHGALHRVLLQQGRSWFNEKLAGYHGKQYTYQLNNIKAVAKKGYGQTNLTVVAIPFA